MTTTATDRLNALRAAAPEHRPSLYNSWLEVATAAQVRRHWRRWMGVFPGWARSLDGPASSLLRCGRLGSTAGAPPSAPQGYTCHGNVRGGCGVSHRTLSAAVACAQRDQRACANQGGYSDRWVVHQDGTPLTSDEHERVLDLADEQR